MVDSMNNTPALTDDKGDEFAKTLQTLHEGLETSIWVKYSVTSMQCRLALSHTAMDNIQTIIDVSGQEMDRKEYGKVYMAILESIVKAYHNWKTTLWASTPELKGNGQWASHEGSQSHRKE